MGLLTWRSVQRAPMVQWIVAVVIGVLAFALPHMDALAAMPTIGSRAPVAAQANPLPVISATFQASPGAVIDTGKILLKVDSVDVTGKSAVSAGDIRYTPASKLADGNHSVSLWVADKAGSMANATWVFTVDTSAPAISNMLPAGPDFAAPNSTISASLGDKGSGVDTTKTVLLLDGVDVSAAAQKSVSAVSYKPASALAAGAHRVELKVQDKAGNSVRQEWGFNVAGQGAQIVELSPADGALLAADALPAIGAKWQGGAALDAGRSVFEVDGKPVLAQARIDTGSIEYKPAQALLEGAHTVRLLLADQQGGVAEKAWAFTTRSAPQIDQSSLLDGVTFQINAVLPVQVRFSDIGSGIDAASVKLALDGVELALTTAERQGVIERSLPAGAYAIGQHSFRFTAADKAGNTTVLEGKFNIESPATTVFSQLKPGRQDGLPAGSQPVISASYSDAAGIDPAKVRVMLDGVDVSARASIGAGGFSYQAQGLAVGRHLVYLRVTNNSGRDAYTLWSFEIEAPTNYELRFADADGSVFLKRDVEIKVVASSDRAAVASVSLNDKPMRLVSTDGRIGTYALALQLQPGDNLLKAQAVYTDNRSKDATLTVNYGKAPVVTITAPADRSTLGPVVDSSPRDLTGIVERPTAITGTVDRDVDSVTINQQQATLNGKEFRFERFFLHEGTNLLTVVATDKQGRVGSASITVSVDQTAPFLAVEAPLNNAITSANSIDVQGTVNDAVEGYYAAPDPTVTVRGGQGQVQATVADKQFFAAGVPLALGENNITVSAADQAGNVRSVQLRVMRIGAGSARLTSYAGNGQSGRVGSALPKPLTVAALDRDGKPLADTAVTFDVMRGTGNLARDAGAGAGVRNLVVKTNADGLASVWLVLGKQSGPASNTVRASAAGMAEGVTFVASGEKGPAQHVRADLGINQFVATGAQPLEPLTAVVTDDQENRIANAAVRFSVVAGQATFENGSDSIVVATDKNGYAAVRPVLGAEAGETIVKAVPAENGDSFFEALFTMQGLAAQDGPTRFSGMVMNDKGQPLPGARMSIGRTSLSTTVDEKGMFTFDDIPAGKIDLFVDGRTVKLTGQQYPALHFEASAIKGAQNQLPHPIYLPALEMAEARIVGGDQDVVLKMPGFEGYEMKVFANSVTFPDGSKTGPVVVSPISFDKLPMTPPGGYAGFMAPAATIQPSGTRFDPPVQLKIPNTAGLKPGEKKPVYQWDHDLATFVQMGQATVTEDGAFLITDPGTGISKAGWHPIPNPPPPDDCPSSGGAPSCKECQKESSSGGKCPKKSCKPDDGKSCDDHKYCTKDDKCTGGSCQGTKIEDEKNGPAMGYEVNLATFEPVINILTKLGAAPRFDALKVSYTAQEIKTCCEAQQGKMTKGGSGKLEGKLSMALAPWQVWGPKLPMPTNGPGGGFGVFISGEFGGALNGSGTYAFCESHESCWGGGGNIFLEVTAEGGLILKDGKTTVMKATVGLKGGFSSGIDISCTSGAVEGAFFNGLVGQVVLEFMDGQWHQEMSWQLADPYPIPGMSFTLPKLGGE
ncbi:Ig-like domain-containing protein [Pseudoduganella violaceinigra]|uniref:Ig-like domain-containing protein n=1 Tax=Pseudoduganella violaceinigra TaxID=246602 RepID=UPI00042A1F6F|nr:Ig-like domain-containing protein [Pseudoduganella violaceinigra]